MSIQGVGNYLEQTLTGLTPGSNYEVAFWATHRRDADGLNWGGALEELMVVVDGTIIWDSTHPADDFEAHAAAFTAQSDTAVLQFKNNSPGKFLQQLPLRVLPTEPQRRCCTGGDNSVFVDMVSAATVGLSCNCCRL